MRVLWAKMSSFFSRLLPFYPQRQVKQFTLPEVERYHSGQPSPQFLQG